MSRIPWLWVIGPHFQDLLLVAQQEINLMYRRIKKNQIYEVKRMSIMLRKPQRKTGKESVTEGSRQQLTGSKFLMISTVMPKFLSMAYYEITASMGMGVKKSYPFTFTYTKTFHKPS